MYTATRVGARILCRTTTANIRHSYLEWRQASWAASPGNQ